MRTDQMVWRKMVSVAMALLVAGVGGGWSRQPMALSATTLRAKVTLSGEIILESNPAAADLDGDGNKEIIVGGRDGILYVLAYSGSGWGVAWQRQTALDLNAAGAPSGCTNEKTDIRASPAVADLDLDGRPEIVVSTGGDLSSGRNGGVLVYRYQSGKDLGQTFSQVPGWPQPRTDTVGGGAGGGQPDGCWDPIWSTTALGDLDGDGDLEIAVEGLDRRIHAWHHDGSVVDGWPIYRYVDEANSIEGTDCLLRGGWSSPALGDIDGDGLAEVIVGTGSPPWNCPGNWEQIDYRYATVWAINGDSSNVPGWPVATYNDIFSSPAVGDIDGDGQLEVVVGSGRSVEGGSGHWAYAWEGNGDPVTGWPRPTVGDMLAPPALGDIDGDGDLEIVIGCGANTDACTSLYAWHGSGTAVVGFPVSVPVNDPHLGTAYRSMSQSPVLADYDGDGRVEVLITHYSSLGIATLDYAADYVGGSWQFDLDPTLQTDFYLFGAPLVDDLDNDGLLELAIGGGNDLHSAWDDVRGAVYIWDTSSSADGALPWPMFHRDAARSGFYPRPPRLAFPDEIRLYHRDGSGSSETGVVYLANGGEGSFAWTVSHAIPGLQVIPDAGVVTTTVPLQFEISTVGLTTGWHTLGPVTARGTVDGTPVDGSPTVAQVYLYVGYPGQVYLPTVLGER